MKYKEFEFIGSSFKCDKNCPYCTAKITKWPSTSNKVELLEEKLRYLENKGISFKYFIFSGNGEPSLLDEEEFNEVIRAVNNINIFDDKRIQSSGNIFYDDKKLNLVRDNFIIEITRVSTNSIEDMKILGYNRDYINTDNFKKARVRLNYVLLKSKSFDEYLEDIKYYIDKYPNIETVSLKTLNLNTMDSNIDNKYSKWIIDNALTKDDTDYIISCMNRSALFVKSDLNFFDRYEWIYEGVKITFYAKKLSYGVSNVVYYGGELVDYKLKKLIFK